MGEADNKIADNKILVRMLERLFAGLLNGPNLNCRPHNSRQRVDLTHLARLGDLSADDILRGLLGEARQVKLTARVPAPKRPVKPARRGFRNRLPPDETAASGAATESEPELTPEERAAQQAWTDQQAVLAKLRIVADDARTYEQDTGVAVLNLGFPLLSLPPGASGVVSRPGAARRVLAPIAFLPITIAVRGGPSPTVEIACRADGADFVTPNTALLAWLEKQSGKSLGELFPDENGGDPWREIGVLVREVAGLVNLAVPPEFAALDEAAQAQSPGATGGENAAPLAPREHTGGRDRANQAPSDAPRSSDSPEKDSASPPAASAGTPGTTAVSAVPSADCDRRAAGVSESSSAPPHRTGGLTPPARRGKDASATTGLPNITLGPAPRADDEEEGARIVAAAVLGLFPMNNEGLLRDCQAMVAGEALDGPVGSFIRAEVRLDRLPDESYDHEAWSGERRGRTFADERMVTHSDPCQSRAVRLVRECRGLVIHGPPGTGKSQTITNIIGDHLARGERVLMVCDKRTALDVVYNRLQHMGLGSLCALVHDPVRDRRELYRSVREQLEALGDKKVVASDERKLKKIDKELQALHEELSECWSLLMRSRDDEASFHDLVGAWLSIDEAPEAALDGDALREARIADWESRRRDIVEILDRAADVDYAENPWTSAAGMSLAELLSRPVPHIRAALADCVRAARAADATRDDCIPAFVPHLPLSEQVRGREELASRLDRLLAKTPAALRARWAAQDAAATGRAWLRVGEAEPLLATLRGGSLDVELAMLARSGMLDLATSSQQLGRLEAYLEITSRWYAAFCFRRRADAAEVLARYGLRPGREAAERLRTFLVGYRARLVLQGIHGELAGDSAGSYALVDDATLERLLADDALLLATLCDAADAPALVPLLDSVRQALTDPTAAAALVVGLRRSAARAAALEALEAAMSVAGLFAPAWLATFGTSIRGGETAAPTLSQLESRHGSLEGVLRVCDAIARLPPPFAFALLELLHRDLPCETALEALHRGVLAAEIQRRLRDDPRLAALDAQRLKSGFERYRALDAEKMPLVRDCILHHWVERQQQRLLVSTGSRLTALGADLRRRLTMRGERALRLRQVVSVGQTIEGGDPLFDLCPVWLASPETVAQVFPLAPVFDVAIFDEASQCRLEEALPVLTRARRVVVAGDPKQLPPTRFFESAAVESVDEEIESEQQLFELHQGEVEDLLAAALGMDIQQCYLDVHYRSRSADLISFSNEQFYSSRLQPIPGHPNNRLRYPPITVYRAGGIYDQRTNAVEAERVCQIVRDLLRRAEPPSIGIACFNLTQRDLIAEKLDELAAADEEFAARLADARVRRGAASFEGLFVKNLENVQGDERDHIIVSTTYGPDSKGRFYRRFGPLGRQGGGRRLNVLVTRAREEVHLVTSIPADVYRSLPPVPEGQQPGGAWLLFSYLAYAERLAKLYEEAHAAAEEAEARHAAHVHEWPNRAPSAFAAALARQLSQQHRVGSDVHWGNDGFCVDVALRHPQRPEDVTVGVLCDGTRFAQAEDPVEWDAFRTAILESQGWRLLRLWSPQFFRDPQSAQQAILRAARDAAAAEEPSARPVVGPPHDQHRRRGEGAPEEQI